MGHKSGRRMGQLRRRAAIGPDYTAGELRAFTLRHSPCAVDRRSQETEQSKNISLTDYSDGGIMSYNSNGVRGIALEVFARRCSRRPGCALGFMDRGGTEP